MRWAGNVACFGKKAGDVRAGFLWGDPRKRDYLDDPDVDGKLIIKYI